MSLTDAFFVGFGMFVTYCSRRPSQPMEAWPSHAGLIVQNLDIDTNEQPTQGVPIPEGTPFHLATSDGVVVDGHFPSAQRRWSFLFKFLETPFFN